MPRRGSVKEVTEEVTTGLEDDSVEHNRGWHQVLLIESYRTTEL